MLNYQVTFEVPEDFNPPDLKMQVQYPEQVKIIDQHFSNSIEGLALQAISLNEIPLDGKDAIIVRISHPYLYDSEDITNLVETLEEKLQRPVIGLTDDFDVDPKTSDEAIKMLENMIENIKNRTEDSQ